MSEQEVRLHRQTKKVILAEISAHLYHVDRERSLVNELKRGHAYFADHGLKRPTEALEASEPVLDVNTMTWSSW
jgi:hypothetical protein